MTSRGDITHWTDPEWLVARLRGTFASGKLEKLAVGLIVGQRSCSVALEGMSAGIDAAQTLRFPLGCIAKLLTGALLQRWVRAERMSVDVAVPRICAGPDGRLMEGITVRQLLEHSHGLDDSTVGRAELRRDGSIDIEALCESLGAAPAVADPGRFYSYGSAGFLLGAAILEAVYGSSFAEIMAVHLLEPLGIVALFAEAGVAQRLGGAVCPSTGGALTLSVGDLVRFLNYQLHDRTSVFADAHTGTICRHVRALPGWHSTERGIYLGWKYYGEGWFGHASEVPDGLMLVRLNPGLRMGVIVFSGRHPPATVASSIFRNGFPSLPRMQMPQLHREWRIERSEASRFTGTYANRASAVTIEGDGNGKLQLRLVDRMTMREACTASLLPAEDRIFFLQPSATDRLPFVQFIELNGSRFG